MREYTMLVTVPEHLQHGTPGCLLCGQVDDRYMPSFRTPTTCEVTADGNHFWYSGHGASQRIVVPNLKRGQTLRKTPSSNPPDAT